MKINISVKKESPETYEDEEIIKAKLMTYLYTELGVSHKNITIVSDR